MRTPKSETNGAAPNGSAIQDSHLQIRVEALVYAYRTLGLHDCRS